MGEGRDPVGRNPSLFPLASLADSQTQMETEVPTLLPCGINFSLKEYSGAVAGGGEGRDGGQDFLDHHSNWRDMNLNS